MRLIALLLSLLTISTSIAFLDTLEFSIFSGRLHKGGRLEARTLTVNHSTNSMDVHLKYVLYKRAWVPVPSKFLAGEDVETLPASFADERGYLELERVREMDLEKVSLKYMGRVDVLDHKHGHQVRIISEKGKFEIDVFYHPAIPELGWGKISLLLHTNITGLGDYRIDGELDQ